MDRKTAFFLIVVIILAAVGVSVLAYPKLPGRMASHWGPGGQVDGWMSKSICVWFMPGIMVAQTVLFFAGVEALGLNFLLLCYLEQN